MPEHVEVARLGDVPELADHAKRANEEHRLGRDQAGKAIIHWINAGQILLEAQATKAAKKTGTFNRWLEANCEFGLRTAYNYMYAAKAFGILASACKNRFDPMAIRYLAAPSCPVEAREVAIEEAEEGKHVSEERAKELIHEHRRRSERAGGDTITCTIDDLQTLIDQGVRFGTIYADPPWAYSNQVTRAATDNHYKTMSLDALCEMGDRVKQLAADPCHLHLWTTNAFLEDALTRVLKAWGFEFKSCAIWSKPQMGLGNYWRVSHEYLLLGVKGSLTFPDGVDERSVVEEPRTRKHSQKPARFRRLVESASPAPYLELFGREAIDGWVVWGDEVDRDLFTESIPAA